MEKFEKKVAAALLDVKAVELRPNEPFTWASGWKSPIYCDNRKLLSYPEYRTLVADALAETVKAHFPKVEMIAAVATGAIAVGALVAERLNLPMVYIRPKPKDHGTGSQIEGVLPKSAAVVIIEDLISTGMSSLAASEAVSKAGGLVQGMVAIFSYNFPKARRSFENANVTLYTLSNYDALVEEAVESGYIKSADMDMLRDWRFKPDVWGRE